MRIECETMQRKKYKKKLHIISWNARVSGTTYFICNVIVQMCTCLYEYVRVCVYVWLTERRFSFIVLPHTMSSIQHHFHCALFVLLRIWAMSMLLLFFIYSFFFSFCSSASIPFDGRNEMYTLSPTITGYGICDAFNNFTDVISIHSRTHIQTDNEKIDNFTIEEK